MRGCVNRGVLSGLVVAVPLMAMIAFLMALFSVAETDPTDVIAVNSLYISLNNPSLQGWGPIGGDPCGENWQGVSCVFSNITALKLSGLNLSGTLPPDLELFESIIEIDLSNNHIEGSIPSQLPSTIRRLSLAGNELTGSLPDMLSVSGQLTDLSLNNNHLVGKIPDDLQLLTSLTNLDLSGNNLSGQLPPSVRDLSALTTLNLQNNKLTGTLDVLEDLPLQNLNIENNLFWGPIPAKLLNIPNFRKNGNPFNTTVLPSPPAFAPFIAPSPTYAEAPRVPIIGPSIPESPKSPESEQTKGFFTTRRIAWIVVFGAVVVIALGACLLISVCRRRQLKEDIERHDIGACKSYKEKSNGISSVEQNNQENKGFNVNLMPPQPSPPCPQVEKAILYPNLHQEVYTRNHSTKNLNSSASVRVFSVATLQLYTNSFSEENLIGEGMLGRVYRAELPDGQILAVKKLNSSAVGQKTDEEFHQFAHSLSPLQHPNIVQLLGYCNEHGQRLLVYEYCKAGTLHDALHVDDEIHDKLTWDARIRLALGVARALQYLHEVCKPPIVHQNFKSTNILLDDKLAARVSDSGLADLKSPGCLVEYGYGAPELDSGICTCKSDVYSFGVVMLELLTGRKAYDRSRSRLEQSLVRWAVPQLHDIDALSRMVDPSLNGLYPSTKSLSRFADIMSRCIQVEPEFRPPMSEIVQDLLHMV